jgi:hypothetical protein
MFVGTFQKMLQALRQIHTGNINREEQRGGIAFVLEVSLSHLKWHTQAQDGQLLHGQLLHLQQFHGWYDSVLLYRSSFIQALPTDE